MNVTEIARGDGRITLKARASAAEVAREFDAALSQLAFDMRVRPEDGATLAQLVGRRLGVRDVDAMLAKQVMPRLVPYVLDKRNIAPALQPQARSASDPHRGMPFEFAVEVVPKPEYELSSYDPARIEVEAFSFDASEVDDRLAHIVDRFVQFEPAPARPVAAGDHCFIAMKAKVDGRDEPRLATGGRVYSLGRGFMPVAFDEGLAGMEPGQTRTVAFEGPALGGAGGTASYECEVTLLELREKVVPKLADAWVSEHVDGYDTLGQLREATARELETQQRAAYDAKLRERIVEKFAERFDGEVPQEIYEHAYNSVLAQLKSTVRLKGQDFAEYVKEAGGAEQVDLAVAMRAERSLAQDYALDALFRHERLQITDEDYAAAARDIDPVSPDAVRQSMESNGRGFALREVAARHAAARWLVEHAHVTVV